MQKSAEDGWGNTSILSEVGRKGTNEKGKNLKKHIYNLYYNSDTHNFVISNSGKGRYSEPCVICGN